jgi:hypothetical protein
MNFMRAIAITVLAVGPAGCAGSPGDSAPLGRSIAAGPRRALPVAPTPAPTGDPASERGGTIPVTANAADDSVSRAGVASSPQLALRRYALAYINWRESNRQTRERELAAISVGPAKLTAQLEAAERSGAAALNADRVVNTGKVVAIAAGVGPERGEWVIVTLEHTTGTGAYAGLPPGTHVTFAEVRHVDGGWVVSVWNPAS